VQVKLEMHRLGEVSLMQVRKVQIIEDDPFIRLIARTALERLWTVVCADGGLAGLAQAEAERPDLILLDVRMPGMDGPTTLTSLKANQATAGIPVIFITASLQTDELCEFRRHDVAGVLEKPFDPMELPNEIKKITDLL
jgi:two-component system, OmpR family, response regulator